MRIVCALFVLGFVGHQFAVADFQSAQPIQIVNPVKHSFQLQIDELKTILERPEIRNRHVVAVSIAGAFRQGKSFLLNFFLRFLYAQVILRRSFESN